MTLYGWGGHTCGGYMTNLCGIGSLLPPVHKLQAFLASVLAAKPGLSSSGDGV